MADIIVAGNTSGSITISAPAVSGSNTLTLPVATDTLVGKATTDTLTNKSIAATQLTGTIAASVLPAGSVLQVKQITTTTTTSTTSATYADATNLTISITPQFTTSKILILCDINCYIQSDNSTYGGVQIVRTATAVYTDDRFMYDGVNANVGYGSHFVFNYLDSPATTSATVNKIQIKRSFTSGTSYPFSVNTTNGTNTSGITVMEIAA